MVYQIALLILIIDNNFLAQNFIITILTIIKEIIAAIIKHIIIVTIINITFIILISTIILITLHFNNFLDSLLKHNFKINNIIIQNSFLNFNYHNNYEYYYYNYYYY